MRRSLPLLAVTLLALGALAAPALAQPLDLTMTVDLYCNDPAVSGSLGSGWNVATTGNLCGGSVVTGGTADAYGVNLLTPTQLTINVTAAMLQVTVLSGPPYFATNCVGGSGLVANPTVTLCLPAGYYSILLSSPLRILMPYEISLACAPCEPVTAETQAWGGIKSLYR